MGSASGDGNPFAVQTPEDIAADEIVDLFVDVFTDFHSIRNPGHTFLHGPRGSGKSMMFRYLEPDCQRIAHNCSLRDIPFFAVYVPIKNTDLKLTELDRLSNRHANYVLNEHLLAIFVASRVFVSLKSRVQFENSNAELGASLLRFCKDCLSPLLVGAGLPSEKHALPETGTLGTVLSWMVELFDRLRAEVNDYLRRLSFQQTPLSYGGVLCGYLDFLLPLLRGLRQLEFMPCGPIYLLLDDADNLNEAQTKILNSWVFCRTSSEVSIKISTQLNYKTFRTPTGQRIDSPHDYSEVNISTVYTSAKSRYHERVEEIVKKRLRRHNIHRTPEDFFPEYEDQEKRIREIADQYMTQWNESGRGNRARDDAYRYARPDYIASLGGTKKASSKYRYAGFAQLVHISSGVVRYFLEPASKMYADERSSAKTSEVNQIGSATQDRIVREEAAKFAFGEFDRLSLDAEGGAEQVNQIVQLRNLIHALGGAFHEILVSKAAERRVFSIALSDSPDQETMDVFRLGVQYGYFHEASIGNKEGTGRTRMFVLSRRLAPFFGLDPSGFAGYKFTTNAALREAMAKPSAFISRIRAQLGEDVGEHTPLPLFDATEE